MIVYSRPPKRTAKHKPAGPAIAGARIVIQKPKRRFIHGEVDPARVIPQETRELVARMMRPRDDVE
jgi:hypothetical protein